MSDNNARRFILAMAFFVGVIGLLAQTLLFRELSIILRSNDLIVGLILVSWLVFAGVGSLIGAFDKRWRVVFVLQTTVGALSVVWCHFFALVLTPKLGEIWPLAGTLTLVAISVGPVSFLTGSAFSSLSRKYSAFGDPSAVYIFEGLGALLGGLLSLVLVSVLHPKIVLPLMAGAAFAGVFALAYSRRDRILTAVLCLAAFGSIPFINLADTALIDAAHRGFDIERYESVYGAIEVAHRQSETYLFQGGVYIGSSGDSTLAENIVHPILVSPNIKKERILIVGGVLQGAVESALAYDPELVTVSIPDPKLLSVGMRNFERFRGLSDPRVRIVTGDPRRAIRTLKETYDVAIFFPGMPQSAATGRLLTDSAFNDLWEKLRGGTIAVGFTVSPNVVTDEEASVFSSILKAMEFRASEESGTGDFVESHAYLAGGIALLIAPDGCYGEFWRAGDYPEPPTKRLNREIIAGLFEEYRQRYIDRKVSAANAPTNTDFRPVAFLIGMMHWERLAGGGVLKLLSKRSFVFWLIPLSVLIIAGLFFPKNRKTEKILGPVLMFSVGALGIGMSIFGLYSFQLAVGQLYTAIGLLSSLFLAGTVVGARLSSKDRLNLDIWLRALWLLLPVSFLIILVPGWVPPLWVAFIIYGIYHIYSGFVVGCLYPLLLKRARNIGIWKHRAPGVLYGFDLLGASVAAPLVGVVLIPSLGVLKTEALLALLIILSIIITLKLKNRRTQ